MKIGSKCMAYCGVTAMLLGAMITVTGCEKGDDNNSNSSSSSSGDFVGTWSLYEGSTIQGNPFWYVNFKSDGTFTISNNSDGSGERVHGTYTVSGGKLIGPFVNPGTGEGQVECTLSNGTLSMDFIEYWHDPYKHVPYVGNKL